jgi:tetratricopeptide (TPR) repeat protein
MGLPSGKRSPDNLSDLLHGRAAVESLDASRLPEAIAAFEQAIAAMPDNASAHCGLATAFWLQYEDTRATNTPHRESLVRAVASARRACELDASVADAWATLGSALAASGDAEGARTATARASALEPDDWRHVFRWSVVSWGGERLRACERTLTLMPGFAPARFLAATVLVARQAYAPAILTASAGAVLQSRSARETPAPFPAIGLHWLRGLLFLRERQIGLAIGSFAREMDESRDRQVYAREFRGEAQIAAGFSHLAAHDATGAVEAFRMALETLPRNGRALVGLYSALQQTSLAREAQVLLPQVQHTIEELTANGRTAEAMVIAASTHGALGDLAAGCDTLEQLLESAPPGPIGWQIPISPSLAPLRAHAGFQRILARLASRAS